MKVTLTELMKRMVVTDHAYNHMKFVNDQAKANIELLDIIRP